MYVNRLRLMTTLNLATQSVLVVNLTMSAAVFLWCSRLEVFVFKCSVCYGWRTLPRVIVCLENQENVKEFDSSQNGWQQILISAVTMHRKAVGGVWEFHSQSLSPKTLKYLLHFCYSYSGLLKKMIWNPKVRHGVWQAQNYGMESEEAPKTSCRRRVGGAWGQGIHQSFKWTGLGECHELPNLYLSQERYLLVASKCLSTVNWPLCC